MQVAVVWLGQYLGPLAVRPGSNSNACLHMDSLNVQRRMLYGYFSGQEAAERSLH